MFAIVLEQFLRQTSRLTSEHEVILRVELSLSIIAGTAGFDEPETGFSGNLCAEGSPPGPALPLDVLPIIHSGPFQLRIIKLKTKRLD